VPDRSKLGAPSRMRLQQLRDSAPPHQAVSMLLRGAKPFTLEQLDALKSDGATIRTHAGLVVTIDVPLAAAERVLDHAFVVASELSMPLYPEARGEAERDID
jgi:hypothetical protein